MHRTIATISLSDHNWTIIPAKNNSTDMCSKVGSNVTNVLTYHFSNAMNRMCLLQARNSCTTGSVPLEYSVNHSLQRIAPKLAPKLNARLLVQKQFTMTAVSGG